MSKVNYHQKSIAYLKRRGYIAGVVQTWNAFGYVSRDLFGFADIVAFSRAEVLLVQVTAGYNGRARIRKILGIERAKTLMLWGYRIIVHEWHYKRLNGRRKFYIREMVVNEEPEISEKIRYLDSLEEVPF